MTNVFAVIGENRDDPDRLLVIGGDGQHYEYQVIDGTTSPIELDDRWMIDPGSPLIEEMMG